MEQSKRSMELQVSKIQLHSRMLEKSRAELQVVLQIEKKKRQRLKEKLKIFKVRQKSSCMSCKDILGRISEKICGSLVISQCKIDLCRHFD